jgi:hypothetical protein
MCDTVDAPAFAALEDLLTDVSNGRAQALMPYDVSGLIESTWEPPAEHGPSSLWFPYPFSEARS